MNYWQRLCAEQGLHAQSVRALVEEVFASPTDARWRVLGAVVAQIRLGWTLTPEAEVACIDLLTIIRVEREWARSEHAKPAHLC